MTEEELKSLAKALADVLKEKSVGQAIEFIDEGPLEGEPASICLEFNDQTIVLGILPV